ncbi:oligosaccharide flippase family protein [Macrococcus sp. FSL R5-0951]|uniref:lipopolysaccharide biosynthesis protein n=1 Tax=Macrococcoides caseolyticum TaxID=69966 RepID=UPI001C6013FB|nr:oligosaccharide flippase family protein [Macrococcus caseolyticus]QYA40741.1 oligosaccharide flippase family protein [Macrococcus caseolyticus]
MNQIKMGIIISYLSILCNILVAIFYTPFFIRILGNSEFGLYSLGISFVGYISIMDLAIGNTIAKFISQNRIKGSKLDEEKIYAYIFKLYTYTTLAALTIFIIIYFNVDNIFSSNLTAPEIESLKLILIILTINFIISYYPGMYNGLLQAYEYFTITKSILVARVLLPAIISVPFLLRGHGAVTAILINCLVGFFLLIVGMILAKNKINLKLKFHKTGLKNHKEILMYCIFVMLSVSVEQFTLNSGQIILGSTSGTEAVATFVIAIQFARIYQQFASSIYNVTFPSFQKLIANKMDNKVILEYMIKISRHQLIILLFILSGFIIFGRRFLIIWAGPDFESSYLLTVIIMAAITIPLIQNTGLSIIQAMNKQTFRTGLILAITIIMILVAIYSSHIYGALGVALSIALISYLLYSIIINVYFHYYIKLNMLVYWKEMIKVIMPISIVTLVYFMLYNHNIKSFNNIYLYLIINIIIYTIIYLIICWLLFLSQNDKKRIIDKLRRR